MKRFTNHFFKIPAIGYSVFILVAVDLVSSTTMAVSNNRYFSDNPTLQEYISFGLANNPELQARHSEWNASAQKVSDVG